MRDPYDGLGHIYECDWVNSKGRKGCNCIGPDTDALNQISYELHDVSFASLNEEGKLEVAKELEVRDSMGWRS